MPCHGFKDSFSLLQKTIKGNTAHRHTIHGTQSAEHRAIIQFRV